MKEILVILGGSALWLFLIFAIIMVFYWSVFSAISKDRIPGNHE